MTDYFIRSLNDLVHGLNGTGAFILFPFLNTLPFLITPIHLTTHAGHFLSFLLRHYLLRLRRRRHYLPVHFLRPRKDHPHQ